MCETGKYVWEQEGWKQRADAGMRHREKSTETLGKLRIRSTIRLKCVESTIDCCNWKNLATITLHIHSLSDVTTWYKSVVNVFAIYCFGFIYHGHARKSSLQLKLKWFEWRNLERQMGNWMNSLSLFNLNCLVREVHPPRALISLSQYSSFTCDIYNIVSWLEFLIWFTAVIPQSNFTLCNNKFVFLWQCYC